MWWTTEYAKQNNCFAHCVFQFCIGRRNWDSHIHKQEKCFERMSFSSKTYAVGFPWPCHIGTCLVPIFVLWTHAPKHGLRRHWIASRFLDCVNVRGTQVDQTKMSVFYNKQTSLISPSTTCLFVRSALHLWNLLQTSHLRWSKKNCVRGFKSHTISLPRYLSCHPQCQRNKKYNDWIVIFFGRCWCVVQCDEIHRKEVPPWLLDPRTRVISDIHQFFPRTNKIIPPLLICNFHLEKISSNIVLKSAVKSCQKRIPKSTFAMQTAHPRSNHFLPIFSKPRIAK